MDEEQNPLVSHVKSLRREIDRLISIAKELSQSHLERGGPEATLSYRRLQEAKMWLGKVLEEIGTPLPAQYADTYSEPADPNV